MHKKIVIFAVSIILAAISAPTHAETQADDPSAIAALAREQADRRQFREAESSYRKALSLDPLNISALSGLIALYRQQGMVAKVQLTIAQLTPAQRSVLGDSLKHIEATMLQDQADLRLAKGQDDQAIKYLEQAVQVDADDSSLHLKLARQYVRRGSYAMALALLDNFLTKHPDAQDALYALALYQSEQGDSGTALKTLNRIEPSRRSHDALLLQQRLTINNLSQNAKSLMQSGRKNDALKMLSDAEAASSGNEDLMLTVALAWAEIGDIRHSRALFEKVKSGHTPPSVNWHLRYATFLVMIESDQELHEELEAIAGIQDLSPAEKKALDELQESAAVRMADKQILAGNTTLAHQTLAPFLKLKPDQVHLLLAEARVYRAEHQWQAALDIYAHVLKLDRLNRESRSGLIETMTVSGDRVKALQQLDAWAADSTASEVYIGLPLSGMFSDLGEYARAKNLIDSLLVAHPDATYILYDAWKMAQRAGQPDHEIDYLKKLVVAYPPQRNLSGPLRDTASPQKGTQQSPASAYENIGIDEFGSPNKIQRDWKEKKLAALIDRRSDWFSSAADVRYRSGTAGLSEFHSVEIPLEYKTPWHADDEVFFRTDLIKLNAGNADLTNNSFGGLLVLNEASSDPALRDYINFLLANKNLLNLYPELNAFCRLHPASCAQTVQQAQQGVSSMSQQTAQGMSFTAGYQRDDLSADIGFTPLDFPVTNVVGGIRQKGDLGQYGYSIEVSRRPITSSLLSYAGTKDPVTGEVWGGVVATGGRFGLSLDKGETFGFWSSLGLHSLTGRNVLSNSRLQLMAGGQWRIVNEENRLFSLGLTGMYWHHTQNAGEYTFGHGGYYSPLNYRSLSLPITYAERSPRFSYMLRAAISASQSQMRDAPYFPTDSTMQGLAKYLSFIKTAYPALYPALASTYFPNPTYSGGSSHGTGQSLKAAWEYQVEPKLFVGGLLSLDRSESYAPNRLLFYMRYSLDHPAAQPVFMPPEPIEPSSQF